MGLDVYTYVVFGKRVPRSTIKAVVNQRGCTHDIDIKQNFCPVCGKPVWTENPHDLLDSMNSGALSYFYPYHNTDDVIIGFALAKTDSHRIREPDMLEVLSPEPHMIKEIVQFFKDNDIALDVSELKTYAFSYFND